MGLGQNKVILNVTVTRSFHPKGFQDVAKAATTPRKLGVNKTLLLTSDLSQVAFVLFRYRSDTKV